MVILNLHELTSGTEYKFQFGLCSETYYGKTVRRVVVRSGKQIDLSPLTNKKVKPFIYVMTLT